MKMILGTGEILFLILHIVTKLIMKLRGILPSQPTEIAVQVGNTMWLADAERKCRHYTGN